MVTVMMGNFKMVENMEKELLLMNIVFNRESLEMIISQRDQRGFLMEAVMKVFGKMVTTKDKVVYTIQPAKVISMEISIAAIESKATGLKKAICSVEIFKITYSLRGFILGLMELQNNVDLWVARWIRKVHKR